MVCFLFPLCAGYPSAPQAPAGYVPAPPHPAAAAAYAGKLFVLKPETFFFLL